MFGGEKPQRRIQEVVAPARGITSIKVSTKRLSRDVDIRQQYYIVVPTKGYKSLSTQRPFQMTAQTSYGLFNRRCPQDHLSRRGQPITQ